MSLEENYSGYCRGLSEVTLGVEDVAASVRFYEENVGLVSEVIDETFALLWAGEPGSQQRVVLLSRSLSPIARRPDSKAIRPDDSSSAVSEIGPADFGRTHFAFFVPKDDLMSAVRRLEQHSVEVYGPVEFEWMRAKSYYFLDPDENLVSESRSTGSPASDRIHSSDFIGRDLDLMNVGIVEVDRVGDPVILKLETRCLTHGSRSNWS